MNRRLFVAHILGLRQQGQNVNADVLVSRYTQIRRLPLIQLIMHLVIDIGLEIGLDFGVKLIIEI